MRTQTTHATVAPTEAMPKSPWTRRTTGRAGPASASTASTCPSRRASWAAARRAGCTTASTCTSRAAWSRPRRTRRHGSHLRARWGLLGTLPTPPSTRLTRRTHRSSTRMCSRRSSARESTSGGSTGSRYCSLSLFSTYTHARAAKFRLHGLSIPSHSPPFPLNGQHSTPARCM